MKKYDPIQSLWIGNALSPMEQMCIRSYQQQGHEFYLYVYEQVEGVPTGVVIKDAAEILSADQVPVDKNGGHINLLNQFMYTLLYKQGGWWVNMDTVCIKPFDFTSEFVFSSERYEKYRRTGVSATYIKSPPGATFLKDCLEFIHTRGHRNLHGGEFNSSLISRIIFKNGLEKYIQLPEIFCPVSIFSFDVFFHNFGYELPEESYALKWWNEIWTQNQLNKQDTFSENCLYEFFKKKYIIS
jgi:hypothetical protein